MNDMQQESDLARRDLAAEINANAKGKEALQQSYGQVWDTPELGQDFEVIGFGAPFVVVRRKSDGKRGSLEFQHYPRFYYNFVEDN